VIRVLHIDDEAPIRLLARVNLEWDGRWEVIEAADGQSGVRLAKRELPDLILLNVNLPVLSGFDVATELLRGHETLGCWNGSSAASGRNCGARRSRSCTR
jgi:DNA-binding response OmpR family regulator